MLKRLFALLAILGVAITVVVGRKRSQTPSTITDNFQHPDRSVSLLAALDSMINRKIGWHRLPLILGIQVLDGVRSYMRARNLYDTSTLPATPQPTPQPRGVSYLTARTSDGTFNDLQYPLMGSAGTRFGHLFPLENAYPEPEPAILEPSPRTISRELLGRNSFVPAETLNVLAASWLQFMIRDWLSHGTSPKENPWLIPLAPDDNWWQNPMQIMRTPADSTRPPGTDTAPPTHLNTETHWWDGSQIYGSSAQMQKQVRSGQDGKLLLTPEGLPPTPLLDQLAEQPGWWIGLAMMSTLFVLEHNTICDHLKAEFPTWSDDELFDRARLINVGLMAKIHTVEWTPAIISHPTTQAAMRDEWWGLQGERLSNLFGRFSSNEVISGTPGSATNHFTAPYSHTEEFVAVYRMHPLIPDDYSFRAATDDHLIEDRTFNEVTDRSANALLKQIPLLDLFYSFGTANPGALTLHNYPRFLQQFKRPDGIVIDLAATDIFRMRELGVPRYNQFRRLIHLEPMQSFEELVPAEHPEWAEEIRRVYNNDIERVDLMVGLFAEPKPQGFGFSNTAFHVFILTAPRRLKSDRYFTNDFTPEIYTRTGLNWIANNSMITVLLRHFPGLRPALRGRTNAFVPWSRDRA
ncbi:MAG: peroxidase family protein [Ktedonobacteraceae bacterium]